MVNPELVMISQRDLCKSVVIRKWLNMVGLRERIHCDLLLLSLLILVKFMLFF